MVENTPSSGGDHESGDHAHRPSDREPGPAWPAPYHPPTSYGAQPGGGTHPWPYEVPPGGEPSNQYGVPQGGVAGGPAPYWPTYGQPGYFPAGQPFPQMPDDPLVTPPGAGLAGWFARVVAAVRRGWPVLLPIVAVTQIVPYLLISLLLTPAEDGPFFDLGVSDDPAAALPPEFLADLLTFLAVTAVASILLLILQMAGWAAATWVIVRQAAGEPAGVGAAMSFGARQALPLWGWSLLAGLIILIGALFCFFPAIYLAFALALAGPAYLFERTARRRALVGNPISRSFRLFHIRFGQALGRLVLLAAALIVGSIVSGLLDTLTLAVAGQPLDGVGASYPVLVIAILVGAVALLPAYLVQIPALVVTYAEQRAYEGPVSAASLAAELA